MMMTMRTTIIIERKKITKNDFAVPGSEKKKNTINEINIWLKARKIDSKELREI